jgi:arsenate reductase
LRYLRNRIAAFINLPIESIDRMALSSKLAGIGAMDGSTSKSSGAA